MLNAMSRTNVGPHVFVLSQFYPLYTLLTPLRIAHRQSTLIRCLNTSVFSLYSVFICRKCGVPSCCTLVHSVRLHMLWKMKLILSFERSVVVFPNHPFSELLFLQFAFFLFVLVEKIFYFYSCVMALLVTIKLKQF